MSNDTTEWRDIPEWEGLYRVSNTGLVVSVRTGKILKPSLAVTGYMGLCLALNGFTKHFTVHRLVMLTFKGERPAGMVINHKNGIKTDNRLSNLEYCTQHENVTHSISLYGSVSEGIKNPRAKLNDESVREIRRLYATGVTISVLARMYGVSPDTISPVVHRKTWKHVD